MRTFRLLLSSCLFLLLLPVAGAQLSPAQGQALRAIARNEAASWPGLSTAQAVLNREKAAAYLERYQRQHLPHGLNVDLLWKDRDRSELIRYHGLGDGAIWTGHYLAMLAFRYALERDADTKREILETLGAIDRLTQVSGRAGYIARYSGPADDPDYAAYYRQSGGPRWFDTGLGANAYQGAAPFSDQVWLGDSSRDTYDGIHFGLAAVWAHTQDAEIKAQVRAIVLRVGRRLVADGFTIQDGRGGLTFPSLNSFPAWLRLMLTVCPEEFSAQRSTYEWGVWVYLIGTWLLGQDLRNAQERQYYPNNLNMIRLFTLITLEDSEPRKRAYQSLLRNAWQSEFHTHLNAHFAALYLLCTGDSDPAAAATLQGTLADFPEEKWNQPVDRRGEAEMLNADYARYALLPSERPLRDFFWQRPPALAHGGSEEAMEYPALDYLLPYYMARYLGLL